MYTVLKADVKVVKEQTVETTGLVIDSDKLELLESGTSVRLVGNSSYKILPANGFSSVNVDYVLPTGLDGFVKADDLNQMILESTAGQGFAQVAQEALTVGTTARDTGLTLTQNYSDLDATVLRAYDAEGNIIGDGDVYALQTKLQTMATAVEYLIDRWTGNYVQDRSDWDQEAWNTRQTYDNILNDVDMDTPLVELGTQLLFEDDGAVKYKKTVTLTAQDIYDKSLRVENSQVGYREELKLFADDQLAYGQKAEVLEASAGELAAKVVANQAVVAGKGTEWTAGAITIGQWKLFDGRYWSYLAGSYGELGDGWVEISLSEKDLGVQIGGFQQLAVVGGEITGITATTGTDTTPSKFKINADEFEISNSTNSKSPFTIGTTGKIKLTGDVAIDGALVIDGSITANGLSANSITSSKIVAGSITGSDIATNTLNATQIDVNNLFAQDITATGTITGAIITGGAVNGGSFNGMRFKIGSFLCAIDGNMRIYFGGSSANNTSSYKYATEGRDYSALNNTYNQPGVFSGNLTKTMGCAFTHLGPSESIYDANITKMEHGTGAYIIFNRDNGFAGTEYFSYIAWGY